MVPIPTAHWESVGSIERYTRAQETEIDWDTINRIRDDVWLDQMAAMVCVDPINREAA